MLSSHFVREKDGAVRLVTVDTSSKLFYWSLNKVRKQSTVPLLSKPYIKSLPQKVHCSYMSQKALLLAGDKAVLSAPATSQTQCKSLA